jgi:transglutaminase-like putative cysteine protease
LGAALLRARGIPARTVAHLPTWAGPHYEHWLVEYWHPGAGWVWLETSLDQVQPPPWTLVVINVANPADEDCRAFTPAKERGVAEGAPYQAVIELSADLRPDFTVRDESVSNYATPEVRFHGGDQDLKDLFTAARRAFAGLARQAADGKQDPERTGRLLTAAAGGDVRKVTEAVGR